MAVALANPRALATRIDRRAAIRIAGGTLFLAVVAFLVLLPLVRLQAMAFDSDSGGFAEAYGRAGIGRTLLLTVALAIGSLVIALILGTTLAWASTRLPRRARWLAILPVLPIVIPAVAAVSGWVFLLAPTPGYLNALLRKLPWWSDLREGPINIYSAPWIIILTGFSLTAFVYLFIRSGLANISADHLEAASVSGSSNMRVFFTITLPLLRPALIYGSGVALLLGLGQFTAPLLLGMNQGITVLSTDIYYKTIDTPAQYGTAAALGTPLLVFGVLIVAGQKLGLGDQRRFVTHGGKGFRTTDRPSKLAAALILAFTIVAIGFPLVGLILLSLSKFWSAQIRPSAWSLDNFKLIFADAATTQAIINSVVFSLIAVLIVLPAGFAAASIVLRGKRYPVIGRVLDFVVSLPLGVPAVLFGVGFLVAYSQPPLELYGTPWVMILVYVTLMIPFATRMQMSALLALGENYQEASRMSGAGPVRTTARILLPLLRTSLAAAAALIFVLLTHEFTASVLVRSLHTNVMGTILFDYYSNGQYPVVAAISLVMAAVTTLGVTIALLVGGSESLGSL